jgi:hypothetical protein
MEIETRLWITAIENNETKNDDQNNNVSNNTTNSDQAIVTPEQ